MSKKTTAPDAHLLDDRVLELEVQDELLVAADLQQAHRRRPDWRRHSRRHRRIE